MLLGLSTPLIGTFSINLSHFLNKRKAKFNIMIKHSQEIAHKLTRKLTGKDSIQETPAEDLTTEEVKEKFTKEKLFFIPSLLTQQLEKMKSSYLELDGITVRDARSGRIVRYPSFIEDKNLKRMVEVDIPDPEYFMPIGYTRVAGDNRLHYRFYFKTELENSQLIEKSPFDFFQLIKGRSTKITGSDKPQEVETTGKFKGLIRILPLDEAQARKARQRVLMDQRHRLTSLYQKRGLYMPQVSLGTRDEIEYDEEEEEANQEFEEIARQLLVKSNVLVRLYIIDAFDLAALDFGSLSDPYLFIRLGDTVINEKDNYQKDTSNPKFYKRFDINASLPGESILKITLWDKDDLFSDDKIGTTEIDLEDRFFSTKWKKLPHKPIETRKLFHKSTRHPRGYIRLWLDIYREGEMKDPVDIEPRPPVECEARLIVWRSEGIPSADLEDVSDLYVKAWVNNSKQKETDTHYRCQKGAGSWNWRMKFPVSLPFPHNVVNIQVWDKDLFSSNDFIGDAVIEFNEIAHVAYEHDMRAKMSNKKSIWDKVRKDKEDKFWIDLNKRKDNGEVKNVGKLQVSFELVPIEKAKACMVGEGRDQPNSDPYLPPPIGRFEWSWNPLKLISQTCGPEFKAKICLIFCVISCCLMIIFMIPMIASDVIARMTAGI
jgi:hypothetical protein